MPSVLIRKLLRDMSRNRVQFIALSITVMVGVAFYSSLVTAMNNLVRSCDYAYEQLRFAAFSIVFGPAPRTVLDDLMKIDNVKSLEGRLVTNIGIYINEDRQIPGLAIGINSMHKLTVNDVKGESGRYFNPEEGEHVCSSGTLPMRTVIRRETT